VLLFVHLPQQQQLQLVLRDAGCRYITNGIRYATEAAGTPYTRFDDYLGALFEADPPQLTG
jgi:hypothetical protein